MIITLVSSLTAAIRAQVSASARADAGAAQIPEPE